LKFKVDGLVKSPSAALRFMFRVAGYVPGRFSNRPYLLDYARLASGAFYETIVLLTFYEFIKFKSRETRDGNPKLCIL